MASAHVSYLWVVPPPPDDARVRPRPRPDGMVIRLAMRVEEMVNDAAFGHPGHGGVNSQQSRSRPLYPVLRRMPQPPSWTAW